MSTEYSFEMTKYICGVIFYPVFSIVGVFVNINCIIVFLHASMNNSTNRYLIGIAFGDLMKALNDFIYFPSVLFGKQSKIIYVNYYSYGYFLSQYFAIVTTWVTLAVCFERYLMVVHPICYRSYLDKNKATLITLGIYLIMVLFTLPCGFRYEKVCISIFNTSKKCLEYNLITSKFWMKFSFGHNFLIVQSLVRSIIPLMALLWLNIKIIIALNKTTISRRMESRNRITLMLIIIVCVFIILSLPDSLMSMMNWGYHDAEGITRKIIREISDTLLLLNADVNFFIYLIFNNKFRSVYSHQYDCHRVRS
uniref:GCR046 n=1 Tax=Schmidtea mediterranea TaxID=79327 RepID=A0A193KU87_SCHMD|nr:GCR046 [Schmidtea mediterranea]